MVASRVRMLGSLGFFLLILTMGVRASVVVSTCSMEQFSSLDCLFSTLSTRISFGGAVGASLGSVALEFEPEADVMVDSFDDNKEASFSNRSLNK